MKARITFANTGIVAEAEPPASILRAAIREKAGLPWKCGGGLCGTCRCHIDAGAENLDAVKPKERKHLTEEELAEGWRMACQTFAKGDVTLSWKATS